MKEKKRSVIRIICVWVGICMLASAAAMFVAGQRNIRINEQQAKAYVETLHALLPEPQSAVPQARRDNTMPALALNGTDFIGILEMPRMGSSLPVCADWGQQSRYPCRFGGSIYDKSLQIGATSQKGQYDFYREISVGDGVFFTDMEGSRFELAVTDICYEKQADQAVLEQNDAALTLFIKNIYSFEYIIVSCDVKD